MKSTTYITEITTRKAGNYLSEGRKLGSTCLLPCSPARFVFVVLWYCMPCHKLRNFPREFTEKCFAVFNQSGSAIYHTYRSLLFFREFSSIIPFMVSLQDSSQTKGIEYIFISCIVCKRLAGRGIFFN